jgi:N-acetylmuramate 1-kinase
MQLSTQLQQAINWANSLVQVASLGEITYTPIVGDAGFRQYVRLANGTQRFILVYAPPETEANQKFCDLVTLWSKYNIAVPSIHALDAAHGFMLLDDLGDKRLIDVVNTSNTQDLYRSAIDMLIKIQQVPHSALDLPEYDAALINQELDLFTQWFIAKYLAIELTSAETAELEQLRADLLTVFALQSCVVVHRDFHSKNILVNAAGKLGTVDFQDAVIGPASYDLVSLLKDCYLQLTAADTHELITYYLQQATSVSLLPQITAAQFIQNYQLTGVQRHLKAVGIFARLSLRDNKDSYLAHIPHTLGYVVDLLAQQQIYPELLALISNKLLPRLERILHELPQ